MITTDRDQFVGVHVTEKVKEALQREAKKRKMSASALVFWVLATRYGLHQKSSDEYFRNPERVIR